MVMETSTNKQEKGQIDKLSKPIAKKVAIIGAGPGGLAAAIALQKHGFDWKVPRIQAWILSGMAGERIGAYFAKAIHWSPDGFW